MNTDGILNLIVKKRLFEQKKEGIQEIKNQ